LAKRPRKKKTPNQEPVPATPPSPRAVWRRRIGWIIFAIALTKLGMARGVAVEHFDEGVYASNWFFGMGEGGGGTYPARWFYAPPFLPLVIEILFQILSPSNFAAVLPAGFSGLMIVLFGVIAAKRWSSPTAGWIALVLGMFSGFQTTFAQTALTDVPLGMWWLATLLCLHQGCVSGKLWWGILAGVTCAAGWWTKYNGWMPMAIGVGGLSVAGLLSSTWRTPRAWGVVLLGTLVAALIWSPYLASLQPIGGYTAINANHRGYIVGPAGWVTSLYRQWRNFEHLNGFAWGLCEVLGGWLLAVGLVVDRYFRSESTASESTEKLQWHRLVTELLPVTVVVGLAVTWLGAAIPLMIFALWGLAVSLLRFQRAAESRDQLLGICFLGVWFVGMFILTPLYTPYARLMVPWVIALWIGAAIGMTEIAERTLGRARSGTNTTVRVATSWVLAGGLAVGCLLPAASLHVGSRGVMLPQRSQGILGITGDIIESIARQSDSDRDLAILVHGDPALFFQLRLGFIAGHFGDRDVPMKIRKSPVYPVGDLSVTEQELPKEGPVVWLIVGPQGSRDPGVQEQLKKHPERVVEWEVFHYTGSDYVLLDEYPPWQLKEDPILRQEVIQLYRLGE